MQNSRLSFNSKKANIITTELKAPRKLFAEI